MSKHLRLTCLKMLSIQHPELIMTTKKWMDSNQIALICKFLSSFVCTHTQFLDVNEFWLVVKMIAISAAT